MDHESEGRRGVVFQRFVHFVSVDALCGTTPGVVAKILQGIHRVTLPAARRGGSVLLNRYSPFCRPRSRTLPWTECGSTLPRSSGAWAGCACRGPPPGGSSRDRCRRRSRRRRSPAGAGGRLQQAKQEGLKILTSRQGNLQGSSESHLNTGVLEKSLDRKELGGIYPKMLQVGHFPDIHGVVTCPKKMFFKTFFGLYSR